MEKLAVKEKRRKNIFEFMLGEGNADDMLKQSFIAKQCDEGDDQHIERRVAIKPLLKKFIQMQVAMHLMGIQWPACTSANFFDDQAGHTVKGFKVGDPKTHRIQYKKFLGGMFKEMTEGKSAPQFASGDNTKGVSSSASSTNVEHIAQIKWSIFYHVQYLGCRSSTETGDQFAALQKFYDELIQNGQMDNYNEDNDYVDDTDFESEFGVLHILNKCKIEHKFASTVKGMIAHGILDDEMTTICAWLNIPFKNTFFDVYYYKKVQNNVCYAVYLPNFKTLESEGCTVQDMKNAKKWCVTKWNATSLLKPDPAHLNKIKGKLSILADLNLKVQDMPNLKATEESACKKMDDIFF